MILLLCDNAAKGGNLLLALQTFTSRFSGLYSYCIIFLAVVCQFCLLFFGNHAEGCSVFYGGVVRVTCKRCLSCSLTV